MALVKDQTRETTVRREGETRNDILDVAARLIVENGYEACTMRSISQKLNIKAASLYYHFPSKDDIVVEIMNTGTAMLLEEVTHKVAQLPEKSSIKESLRTAVSTHISCKVNLSSPYMGVYEHLPPIIKKQSRSMRKRHTNFWTQLIESGKEAGEVRSNLNTRIYVTYLLSGLNRVPEWFHPESMTIDEVVETIMLSLWDGICADPSTDEKGASEPGR